MSIPGCQLDYIWNELQSSIGELTNEPDLRWKTQVSDLDLGMEILRHSGYEKLRFRQGVHAFNPGSPRQEDLCVQGQPGTKQVPDPGMVVHTFNLGHTFCWRPI